MLPVAVTTPPVVKLPPLTLPVAVIRPAVPKLPTLALPDTLSMPVVLRLPPDTLPVAMISPAVPKLPTLALPVAFNVPATLTPVPVTTATLALPATEMLTLPLAAGILMFVLPFACGPIKLPAVTLPVTDNEVSVPTDVMFGWAAV